MATRKIKLDELQKLERDGAVLVHSGSGEKFNVEPIVKAKEKQEDRTFLKETHGLITKLAVTMQEMVNQLQIMNNSLMAELKKHKPEAPNVKVEEKVEVNVPGTEPIVFEHEVVEMTNTGRPIKIISTPKENK